MRLSESFSFSSVNCAPSSSRPVFTTWVSFGPDLGKSRHGHRAIEVVRLGAELHRDSSGGQQAGLSLGFGKASGRKQCPQTSAYIVPFQPLAGFQRDHFEQRALLQIAARSQHSHLFYRVAKQRCLPARQRALRYRALPGWHLPGALRFRRLTPPMPPSAAIPRRSPSRYRQGTEQSHQQHRPPRPALRALQSGLTRLTATVGRRKP